MKNMFIFVCLILFLLVNDLFCMNEKSPELISQKYIKSGKISPENLYHNDIFKKRDSIVLGLEGYKKNNNNNEKQENIGNELFKVRQIKIQKIKIAGVNTGVNVKKILDLNKLDDAQKILFDENELTRIEIIKLREIIDKTKVDFLSAGKFTFFEKKILFSLSAGFLSLGGLIIYFGTAK